MSSPLRQYTKAQVARAVRLVREGRSYAVAAAAAKMSAPAVRNHCLSAGVLPRGKNGHRIAFAPGARPFTPEEDIAIVEGRAFGLSFSAIGKRIGRTHSSVRSRLLTIQLLKLRGEA